MITGIDTPQQVGWRSGGSNYPHDDVIDRRLKILGGAVLPLPVGAWPVGEGYVSGGMLHQPVFREVVTEFANHASATLSDHKTIFDVAKFDLSDLEEEPTWLPGAQPDPATVSGRYNVALEEMGEQVSERRGPWGVCADTGGGEFLGTFLGGGLLVPQLRNANQIYAVRMDGTGKAWSKQGWADYPAFMAIRSTEQLAADIPELEEYSSLEYWRDSYTALGIAGDRLIVERRRQWLAPSVAPDFTNNRLEWTVSGTLPGGFYRSYECSGTWRGKWAWRSIGNVDWSPSGSDVFVFEGGFTHESGNPESFQSVSVGNSGSASIASCLADALELAGRLKYIGHFVYDERRYIESWDLATGVTMASREQPVRATLPGFNLQGEGTADVETYSASAVRSWPPHPEARWAGPPDNTEKTYYPPPTLKEGYVGGTWGDRGAGPQVGLYFFPPSGGTADHWLVPLMAGGPAISMGLTPTGIYVRGSVLTDGPEWKDALGNDLPPVHVVSCYSRIAPGEMAQTTVALPWPFDPLSLATDGERLYFSPRDDSSVAMTLSRQGKNLPVDAPNQTLPEWDDEVRRVKRIVCWDAETLAGQWEVDALDHVTTGTKVRLGESLLHQMCGDRIGNLEILDAYLLAMVHGADGQKQLEIERESGEVERELTLSGTALGFEPTGYDIAYADLLCAPSAWPWCHDSLMAISSQLYGVTPHGKVWRLE